MLIPNHIQNMFGFFQSENAGDPFEDYSNGQDLPYWSGVYWLLVTMSTVGYGDINPATSLTRAFIILFIMGSFVSKAYKIMAHTHISHMHVSFNNTYHMQHT